MTGESENLNNRVERLERENRRLKIAGGLGILAAGALLLAGARSRGAHLVEASEFRLVDTNGALRASLTAGRAGTILRMNDSIGKAKISIQVGDDGPHLDLLDGMERPRLSASVEASGRAWLSLREESGKDRARLSASPDGAEAFELLDAGGRSRAVLSLDAQGLPQVALSDGAEKKRSSLALSAEGCPTLKLADPDGLTRTSIGCTGLREAGSGSSEKTAPSSIVLFDRKGAVIFKVPK